MDIAHNAQLHVEYLPLAILKPDPNNPRQHSAKQIKILARAIAELGFNNPVLIDQNNIVIAGHGRLEAAKSNGITSEDMHCAGFNWP